MSEEKRRRKGSVRIGYTSILLIFTMLCLVTFATLSLVTVNSDYRLSKKVADKTSAYYKADTNVRDYLYQVDQYLTDWYMSCQDKESFCQGEYEVIESVILPEGINVAADEESSIYRIECQINDVQKLCVGLKLTYPKNEDGSFYDIIEWKTVTDNSVEAGDDTLPLLKKQ